MKKLFLILMGRYRLFFGFCPKCNSDAPELDTCKICSAYMWGGFGPFPDKILRKKWWNRYKNFIS